MKEQKVAVQNLLSPRDGAKNLLFVKGMYT